MPAICHNRRTTTFYNFSTTFEAKRMAQEDTRRMKKISRIEYCAGFEPLQSGMEQDEGSRILLPTMKDVLLGYLRRMLAYFPSFQVIIFYLSIAPMVEKRESSHFLELMPHLWMEATVKHLLHLTMGNVLAMCFVPTENPLSAH